LLEDPSFQIETDEYESLVLAIPNGVPDNAIDLSPEAEGDAALDEADERDWMNTILVPSYMI